MTFPDKIGKNKTVFLLLLFITTLFLRLPTLFNDYYDVDELSAIVQTREYMADAEPGKDFIESKLPVYHAIFKSSYFIMPQNGWKLVHVITILIVFLTALFVYGIGCRISGKEAGITAAFLYAVLISSFNRHFMATNGEIIYNLPVIAGLYFFILFLQDQKIMRKIIYGILFLIMGIIASQVKFHGNILFIAIIFFTMFLVPYHYNYFSKKYIYLLLSIGAILVTLGLIDYMSTKYVADKIVKEIYNKIFYATADKGMNPFYLLIKYAHHQALFLLWHGIAWIPASVYIWKKIREQSFAVIPLAELSLITLCIFSFLMIFGGGARLYYHYFMACYPALCTLAGISLISLDTPVIRKYKQKCIYLLLVPAIFFWVWNMKDIYLKYHYPDGFHKEGKILFWTRAALIGSLDDYLLPHRTYKNVVDYIKKNTDPTDSIFVWGDGPYLYYFSERRMGIKHLWPKNSALKIARGYEEHSKASLEEAYIRENGFIEDMESKKPELFIDTSSSTLANFNKFPLPPLMRKYVASHYTFEVTVDNMGVYRRNKENSSQRTVK